MTYGELFGFIRKRYALKRTVKPLIERKREKGNFYPSISFDHNSVDYDSVTTCFLSASMSSRNDAAFSNSSSRAYSNICFSSSVI